MNKRKIDINQIKKLSLKGRINTKSAKYQTMFSFFKQKEAKQTDIFTIRFTQLVRELMQSLITYEFFVKLESKQQIKPLNFNTQQIQFDDFDFKPYSNQYPIKDILECLFVVKSIQEKTKKPGLMIGIIDNKQIAFFKKLRGIYSQFCSGDKILLQVNDYPLFYENFKSQWIKKQQKGRENNQQKMQKRIVRSLLAFIILVENNILVAIDQKQKKQLQRVKSQQYNFEIETKSEKKKSQKGKELLSACTKNSTELISNFSNKQISQKSQQQLELKIQKADYSQKSLKITTNQTYKTNLFDKSDIKNLKFRIKNEEVPEEAQVPPFINLLQDGLENVLIEEAFNLQIQLNHQNNNYFNFYMPPNPVFLQQDPMFNYPPGYMVAPIHMMPQYEDRTDQELHQMRRSMGMLMSDSNSVKSRQSETKKGLKIKQKK